MEILSSINIFGEASSQGGQDDDDDASGDILLPHAVGMRRGRRRLAWSSPNHFLAGSSQFVVTFSSGRVVGRRFCCSLLFVRRADA
jgi:hypothetical protein